ncbi:MAG TPA: TylF/MycF/NovP-related O-methyltransferase [Coleofasciculaceae cyanobacterium]|jgi:hypothetical protein
MPTDAAKISIQSYMGDFQSMLKSLFLVKDPTRLMKRLSRYGVINREEYEEYWAFKASKFTYKEEGLWTTKNVDFLEDPAFQRAFKLGKETGSWGKRSLRYRNYIICWAATQGAALEGDFVECGVNKGGFARMIIDYVGFEKLNKQFWLLDTYEGLVEECFTEEEKACGKEVGNYYEPCYETVVKTFQPFPNVKIIKGVIPHTLPEVTCEKVAFLSIDMNCVLPEIAAIEYFWERLTPGAPVVLDDYGWPEHEEQKKGFDQFAKQHNIQVLTLPTGQGLIIKPSLG